MDFGTIGIRTMIWDVIIIGGGSAGCVLAARLSEDPRCSVLLVEAGPDYTDLASTPPDIAAGNQGSGRSHDWGYATEPAEHIRSFALPRGKLVGGCSATNAAVALRGVPGDYDEWARLGNPGWSFDEVLPFFRWLETDSDFADPYHGRGGPVPIRRYADHELTALQQGFAQACLAAGYPAVADHNAPHAALGVGPFPMNNLGDIRQSAALTHLLPARGRPNLTIRHGVLVDRVVLSRSRAVGMRLAQPNETLSAERIVLAAGSYGSPAILMRSGIGPADHLARLDISVQQDLPVGRSLIDHPLYHMQFSALQTGPLPELPAVQMLLTWSSSASGTGTLDLHIVAMSRYSWPQTSTGAAFRLLPGLMKPRSSGRLWLRSSDPSAAPCIDPGYFTDPADMPRMIEAIRMTRVLARTPPLADLVLDEVAPGDDVDNSDDALRNAIYAGILTYHHPVATCRMGPASDPGAVVDPTGRVHGIEQLWVVDASIMPTIPAANTNLPTIMVAERCSAWLQ